ncbi:4'-phosphopantetheinyl transferase family protein [Nocardia sp. NPDC052566]|uniref:4'-phosphopantetheinyl transferase family protein n=1 Tax=Nocardia sp. NPDC052566 TaxID=3364330 RepID=UPI0037CAB7A2
MFRSRDRDWTITRFEFPESALDEAVILDPASPLHIVHTICGLTIATVSVDWLRRQPAERMAATTARHLSAEEAAYAATLWIPKRRFEWVAGRLAAKCAVRAYRRLRLGIIQPTQDIAIMTVREGPCAGKPFVNTCGEIGISHSGDFAIGVCTTGPVGVDLEQNRRLAPPLVNALRLPVLDGANAARSRLRAMPMTLRWACTEAVLKYFGFGLRVDPREVVLTAWRTDGSFTWRAGPGLRSETAAHGETASMPWPHRAWAGEIAGYSLALVW